ncbi:hypothetical protein BGZ73_006439 [Actinomortierella ambigua]|nr:hypothetical protein BGZ73_006439 [Actinomortierella ambigua]
MVLENYPSFFDALWPGSLACAADPEAGFVVLFPGAGRTPQGLLYTEPNKWTLLKIPNSVITMPTPYTCVWPVKDSNKTTFMYGYYDGGKVEFGVLKDGETFTPAQNSWATSFDANTIVTLDCAGGNLYLIEREVGISLSRIYFNSSVVPPYETVINTNTGMSPKHAKLLTAATYGDTFYLVLQGSMSDGPMTGAGALYESLRLSKPKNILTTNMNWMFRYPVLQVIYSNDGVCSVCILDANDLRQVYYYDHYQEDENLGSWRHQYMELDNTIPVLKDETYPTPLPDTGTSDDGGSTAVIVGKVIGSLLLVCIIIFFIVRKTKRALSKNRLQEANNEGEQVGTEFTPPSWTPPESLPAEDLPRYTQNESPSPRSSPRPQHPTIPPSPSSFSTTVEPTAPPMATSPSTPPPPPIRTYAAPTAPAPPDLPLLLFPISMPHTPSIQLSPNPLAIAAMDDDTTVEDECPPPYEAVFRRGGI